MTNSYSFYCVDTETDGLNIFKNSVIEVSFYRLSDNVQKTWLLKSSDYSVIEAGALRVNGHKLEDITHQSKVGRETYLEPSKAIIEIENWIAEDGMPSENRCLIAQNLPFDKGMLEQLWIKCGAKDSFPFGRRYLDTIVIEMFLNICQDKMGEGYSLANLIKKYSVKNDKAHTAASDCLATVQVFRKQQEFFTKILNKND